MLILQGIVLGIVQGLCEFLPISSSGHLILVPALLHWNDPGLAFDAVLHLGTLAALLVYFWKDIFALSRVMLFKLAVATLPAIGAALLLNDLVEHYARGPRVVAFGLAFWAMVLFVADRWSGRTAPLHEGEDNNPQVTWTQALVIGCAQAIAIMPGTSRSGITITAALFMGLRRTAAARFSFLLSIPITAAAGGYELLKLVRDGGLTQSGASVMMLVVGSVAACVSGLWAIRFLLTYVVKRRYDLFVFYRLALAVVVLLLV
ncbi:MAG: undecaprenyl-diphosphate phosphatase [Patescibacteria group bacterium]